MLPIGTRPIIELLVRQLIFHGFKRIHIATGHLAHIVKAHFSYIQIPEDVKMYFYDEVSESGTAGSLTKLVDKVSDQVLVINGDLLALVNFSDMMERHRAANAEFTVACRTNIRSSRFGVLELSPNNDEIVNFVEKPQLIEIISIGIYILSPTVVNMLRDVSKLDMPELIQKSIESGFKVMPYTTSEYWQDIGRFEDFIEANEYFSLHSSDFKF